MSAGSHSIARLRPGRLPSHQAESRPPLALHRLVLALSVVLLVPGWPMVAGAADVDAAGGNGKGARAEPVRLRVAPSLDLSDRNRPRDDRLPVFGSADRVSSKQTPDGPVTTFEGAAQLRKLGATLTADQIEYLQNQQRVEARGDVTIEQAGYRMVGPSLKLRLDVSEGTFDAPVYDLQGVGGRGRADRLDFKGRQSMHLFNGTFSSCKPDNEAWRLEARRLDLDLENSKGYGRDARLVVRDHTVMRFPALAFPLNDDRQSGFLVPRIDTSSSSGLELTVPYYFNLAPNYDLTVSPRLGTRRGLRLGNEFRFLTRPMGGTVRLDYIPNDSETGRSRYLYDSTGSFNRIFGWNGAWNLKGVSDDNYFVDYSRTLIDASERSLPREVFFVRGMGDWSMLVRAIRYQNILEARPAPPYEKLPQIQLTNNQVDLRGFDISTLGDLTQFRSPQIDAVEGTRLVVNPSISYPLQGGGWFFTPKFGMHAAHYQLNQFASADRSISRVVPTFSVDTGLVMERDSRWLGERSIQTLEPRLFYVRTPYRDQDGIPVFDSAASDLSFAQLFSENAFTGHDRIADANHLTAALVSRQIEQATGIERLRLAMAQRFYFSQTRVTIPGVPVRTDRRTDLLFAASGDFRGGHSVNAGMQYALRDERVPRLNLSYRYRPGDDRVFNVGVRYQSHEYAQWDTSFAWPVSPQWRVLGGVNYSFLQRRNDPTTGQVVSVRPGLVEGVAGFEYAQDCWAVRFVVRRFVTSEQKNTTAASLQFDLRGLGSLGSNPSGILSRNIPGYSVPDNSLTPVETYYGYE
ncbi:MAG: LPS-assembly protein LptD [Lautropia sp.]|nr:LPS-assembly protein LptD [Lautropia sp.]